MMADEAKNEYWVCVEMMGHSSSFGRLTEKTMAGCPCLELEVPDTQGGFKEVQHLFPEARSIFRITSCTRESAIKGANPYAQQSFYPKLPEAEERGRGVAADDEWEDEKDAKLRASDFLTVEDLRLALAGVANDCLVTVRFADDDGCGPVGGIRHAGVEPICGGDKLHFAIDCSEDTEDEDLRGETDGLGTRAEDEEEDGGPVEDSL
jgi:hypothetical protein